MDDGLPVRQSGPWARDKLGILANYYPAFARACRKARRWYYVDGFAGPGLNRIAGTDELMWGSPLLALRTDPPFTRCVLLERRARSTQTLAKRTLSFGERAVVRRGDVNRDLVPLMDRYVERSRPCLCVLDPEGMELHWETVRALSGFRHGPRLEQLILFQIDGLSRVMPLWPSTSWAEAALARFWPTDRWRGILQRRERGELTADDARTEYLRLYVEGLHDLGYEYVLNREIRESGRVGRIKYFLVFATDSTAGRDIMDWCYDKVFPRDEEPAYSQLALDGLEPPPRRARRDL